MNKTSFSKKERDGKLIFCALRGFGVGVFCALLLAAALCLAGLSADDPNKYARLFAALSVLAASFAAGFTAAREKGSQTLLCGILSSLFLLCAAAILALALSLPMDLRLFALSAPCMLISGILGANMGVGSKRKKRSKR